MCGEADNPHMKEINERYLLGQTIWRIIIDTYIFKKQKAEPHQVRQLYEFYGTFKNLRNSNFQETVIERISWT